MRAIRDETHDGEELVRFMLRVFRGEVEEATLKHRLEAATWLSDRGFGRPIQGLEHTGKDGEALIPIAALQAVVEEAEDGDRSEAAR